ncbi:Sapep family Mn(2+)-dependent dipeptidase [Spiroplasma endosymbiont of Labia minor]|uniref:Sapep family Mn(2+)-dependent dipeptidase n=1 Tax=Spiroplasma endosymbiont of Labia minor TaxID=3066305 RepID=UPI0030D0B5DC
MFEINLNKLQGKYFEEALEQIKEIVKIPSYRSEPTASAPYGENTLKSLDFALDLAEKIGFTKIVKDKKNRYGYAEIGNAKEMMGILCHLDVVPPGNINQWVTNPFEPIIKDGKLIGRGVFDDKGPTIINMFAVKYLIDHNFLADYRIRMIFGTAEETDWDDMNAYVANEEHPAFGYTPDGEFPMVYAEKFIRDIDILGNYQCQFSLMGGSAYNVINDQVTYIGPKLQELKEFLQKNNVVSLVEKDNSLIIQGTAGHGSLPHMGINAATYALNAIYEIGINDPIAKFVHDHIHLNYNMTNIFPDGLEDETGKVTASNGIVEMNDQNQRFTLNLRIPVHANLTNLFNKLNEIIKSYGLKEKQAKLEKSVYIAKDSMIATKIMSVYREVTGEQNAEPVALGGGTYAKAMENIVAFGAEFDVNNSTMHAYNEYVTISDLQKMLEIYTKAIAKLAKK